MRRLFAVAGLMVAIGCATPQDLLDKSNAITFESAETPQQVQITITSEWMKHTSSVSVVPIDGGSMVYLFHSYPSEAADMAVRIVASGSGSTVHYGIRVRALSPDWMEAPLLALKAQADKK